MNSAFVHFLEDGTILKILSEITGSSEPGGPVFVILVHPISTRGQTMPPPPDFRFPNLCCPELCVVVGVVYDRNYYFGLGPIPIPNWPILSADTVT